MSAMIEEVRLVAKGNRKKPARSLLEKREAKRAKRDERTVRERKRSLAQRA